MISITKLAKRYGSDALVLKHVSIEVEKGEFFTLLGPSGCSKTTLLRCIAGLENAEEGRIAIDSQLVFDGGRRVLVPPERRNIGMVFQSYAIWPHMTVLENVAFPARARRLPDPLGMAREALRVVEMEKFQDRRATQLSGGQQQRVALARAITGRPKVLLLDEPLSNLDASLREQMRVELRRLQKELGITTVLVTHDQTEALSMSDRIAVINSGEIVEIGSPEKLYLEPASRFTAGFLGDSRQLQSEVRDNTLVTPLGIVPLPPQIAPSNGSTVHVRPDQLHIVPPGTLENAIRARVVARRFMGFGHEYDVEIGGPSPTLLQIRDAGERLYEQGDIVHIEASEKAYIVT